jgi:hypothetical protein
MKNLNGARETAAERYAVNCLPLDMEELWGMVGRKGGALKSRAGFNAVM